MDISEFIVKCEAILKAKGEHTKHAVVLGYIGIQDIRQYKDDVIAIASATHEGKDLFEVTVTYEYEPGKSIDNPCIMISGGDMFRYHGDWRRAVEHVKALTT